jgi:hypothetical protein
MNLNAATGVVVIDYTNWRHERRKRTIKPVSIRFGATVWHKEPQWLLAATDVETGNLRGWTPATITMGN